MPEHQPEDIIGRQQGGERSIIEPTFRFLSEVPVEQLKDGLEDMTPEEIADARASRILADQVGKEREAAQGMSDARVEEMADAWLREHGEDLLADNK